MLRTVPLKKTPPARRLITGDGEPDSYFIDFPLEDDFKDKDCEFFLATEEEGVEWNSISFVGAALIREKLQHLRPAKIGYLWKAKGGSRHGHAVLGKAIKTNPLLRTFSDRHGLVVLGADHIRTFKLTRYQVEALVYHELNHFWVDDEGKLQTKGHDFEAFTAEVQEYGMWKPDLALAGEAFRQIELPGIKK